MTRIGTPRYKNEINNVYGKLTVLEFAGTNKNVTFWKCKCECGGEVTTTGSRLRNGQCKSCGVCDIQRKTHPDSPMLRHFRGMNRGAKSRGLEVDLSFDEYKEIVKQRCGYCDSPILDTHYAYSRRRYSKGKEFDVNAEFNGIDRMDSSKGYIKGNMISCCSMCNRMKSDFESDIFLNKVKEIYEHATKNGHYTKD